MHKVFLALGSNVGDRKEHIKKVIKLLKETITDINVAPLYESRAVGYEDQPHFFNTVLKGNTKLTPQELLRVVKDVEKNVGRVERFHWGPREIDIDIIFYDDIIYSDEDLTIPHPRAHERDFVLKPLCDLEPSFTYPLLQKTVRELLDALPKSTRSIIQIV